nr:MAG TPA: hypothetical protein [Caudoviricetes sp.]
MAHFRLESESHYLRFLNVKPYVLPKYYMV